MTEDKNAGPSAGKLPSGPAAAASEEDTVRIVLRGPVVLRRRGEPDYPLRAGENIVPQSVADHDYVAAHTKHRHDMHTPAGRAREAFDKTMHDVRGSALAVHPAGVEGSLPVVGDPLQFAGVIDDDLDDMSKDDLRAEYLSVIGKDAPEDMGRVAMTNAVRVQRRVEEEESGEETDNSGDEFDGKSKKEIQRVYASELGEKPAPRMTIPELVSAIKAKRAGSNPGD